MLYNTVFLPEINFLVVERFIIPKAPSCDQYLSQSWKPYCLGDKVSRKSIYQKSDLGEIIFNYIAAY